MCCFDVFQEDGGWWEGIKNGVTGVFPSNFVELVRDDTVNEAEKGDSFVFLVHQIYQTCSL